MVLTSPLCKTIMCKGGNLADGNYMTAVALLDKPSAACPTFDVFTYLALDLSSLTGKKIQSAKLTFYASVADSNGTDSRIRAVAVTSAWSESTVTFNIRPTTGASIGCTGCRFCLKSAIGRHHVVCAGKSRAIRRASH